MNRFSDQDLKDMGLRVEVLAKTDNPQMLVYAALTQDYSEGNSFDSIYNWNPTNPFVHQDPKNLGKLLSEREAGERAVNLCMKYKHFGPLEHPAITFNVIGYPHTLMQQLRTHRVGTSFDVQSGRYTGQRLLKVAANELPEDEVFWFRPEGIYQDKGTQYVWTEADIREAKMEAYSQAVKYARKVEAGMPKEMARDLYITYGIRQNFVMSLNLRSAWHMAEMRATGDAELEAQWCTQQLVSKVFKWAPELTTWWIDKRLGKNLQAP